MRSSQAGASSWVSADDDDAALNDLTFGSGATSSSSALDEDTWAAEAARHEAFLLSQHSRGGGGHMGGAGAGRQAQGDAGDEDAWNQRTFDDMADWDDGASLGALHAPHPHSSLMSSSSHSSSPYAGDDDDGGDEVDVNVRLYGIMQGRDADLLSRGSISLSSLQSAGGAEEEMDSSMLDSVLKALEEEEEEEQLLAAAAHPPPPQHESAFPPSALNALVPRPGSMSVEELEAQLRSSKVDGGGLPSSPLPSPDSAATVSVPLPSDQYGAAPSLYIPLPARHFSTVSKAELALILKLQLNQLQAQSGADDAFYSQVWQRRKGKRQLSRTLQQMPPILQRRWEVNNGAAHPLPSSPSPPSSTASFASLLSGSSGALGRLQTSSLKKPKKLMELAPDPTHSGDQPTSMEDEGSALQTEEDGELEERETCPDVSRSLCPVCVWRPLLSSVPRRKLFGSSRAIAYLIEEGFLALIAFEEADDALRQLPPPPPQNGATAESSVASASSSAAAAPSSDGGALEAAAALNAERQRLLALRHHCMLALLDQLDVLSVPPPSFPPDTASLRAHLLHLLYPLPKGRLLLLRSLQRLSPPHTFDLLYVLTSNLPSLCAPPTPSPVDESLAVSIAEGLYATPHHTVNLTFAQLLMAPPDSSDGLSSLVSVLRSKLGCMAVQVLVKKGQELHSLYLQQRPPPGVPLPSTALPSHLLALSRDLGLWESLTGELLKRMEGHWAEVLHLLPTQPPPPSSASTSSASPVQLLASARATWDLLSQLVVDHLRSPAPFAHTPPPPASTAEAEGAASSSQAALSGVGRDADLYHRLVLELNPLLASYLRSTYLTGPSPPLPSPPSTSSSPSPSTSFASVASSRLPSPSPAPALLPVLSPSLLSLAAVVLSSDSDSTLLKEAEKAQKESEAAVRAFIAAKRQRRQPLAFPPYPQQRSHPHMTPPPANRPPHRGAPSSVARLSPQSHHPSHFSPPPQKSSPGSYAFAAAQKAASPVGAAQSVAQPTAALVAAPQPAGTHGTPPNRGGPGVGRGGGYRGGRGRGTQ